jgi:energy-coupling factor transport system ATP-binding protein
VEKISFLKIKDLNYFYPEQQERALKNINLEIEEGDFVLFVGGSGSGKSTLVKAIAGLVPEFYGGKVSGEITINKKNINEFNRRDLVQKVGIVFQDPETQLVMTKVEDEIAFGLENIALNENLIRRRIFEVSGALALNPFLCKNVPYLSGGLKQKVALASILAMQPDILILDEPTSQLDPVAGEEILTIIRRLNEENGITVILIEQRLERCFHLADRFVFIEKGEIKLNTKNVNMVNNWVKSEYSPFVPPIVRLFSELGCSKIPLTVKEGRKYLKNINSNIGSNSVEINEEERLTPVIEVNNLWYVYENGEEALRNINIKIFQGEFLVVMGDNSAGKTTFIKNINGLLNPSRGSVKLWGKDGVNFKKEDIFKKIAYLSQNPNDYLFKETVEEELIFTQNNFNCLNEEVRRKLLLKLGLEEKTLENPRDLSSGERQRVALASILVSNPEIIILDEPTRGLDYDLKIVLGDLLLDLQKEGITIVMITHDVEFAAEYGERIALMSRGEIIAQGRKEEILSGSNFYSPQISKLFKNINNRIVTLKEGKRFLEEIGGFNE